jgi:hypothetical protein
MIADRIRWSGPFDEPFDFLRALSLSKRLRAPSVPRGLPARLALAKAGPQDAIFRASFVLLVYAAAIRDVVASVLYP